MEACLPREAPSAEALVTMLLETPQANTKGAGPPPLQKEGCVFFTFVVFSESAAKK